MVARPSRRKRCSGEDARIVHSGILRQEGVLACYGIMRYVVL